MISGVELAAMIEHATPDWLVPLNEAMDEWSINNPLRVSAFLAQAAVESDELRTLAENLNYSAAALPKVPGWARRFPPGVAERVGRTSRHPADQEAIANIAYANRFGNRGPESGDGWRYRGSGIFQITFADNHVACAHALGIPEDDISDLLRTDKEVAARGAGWYWHSRNLNMLADRRYFELITERINSAKLHMTERMRYWVRNRSVLGVA